MVEKPEPSCDVPPPPPAPGCEPVPPEGCDVPLPPEPPPDPGIPDPHPALPYNQARSEMLKDMTPEQRIQFWQSDTPEQQDAVNEWHQMRFGVPPQPNVP